MKRSLLFIILLGGLGVAVVGVANAQSPTPTPQPQPAASPTPQPSVGPAPTPRPASAGPAQGDGGHGAKPLAQRPRARSRVPENPQKLAEAQGPRPVRGVITVNFDGSPRR
jgi:hypothetical protein